MSTSRAAGSPADGPGGDRPGGESPGGRQPVLVGERTIVTLAGGDAQDPHRLLAFHARNGPFLKPWLPTPPDDFLTPGFWKRWCAQSVAAFKADREVRLAIRSRGQPDGAILGQINFSAIIRGAAQSCSVGYHLGEAEQGRGLMFEAMEMAVAYMFGPRRMHRIAASYQPGNQRSARMLERLGFEEEGFAKAALFIDGAWRDHVLTALVNPSGADPAPGAPL